VADSCIKYVNIKSFVELQ